MLKKRSEDVKNRQGICNHANLLTGKLYCTHCGAAYYRRDSVDRSGTKEQQVGLFRQDQERGGLLPLLCRL